MLEPRRYARILARAQGGDIMDAIAPDTVARLGDRILAMGVKVLMIKAGHRGAYLRTGDIGKLNAATSLNLPVDDWSNLPAAKPVRSVTQQGSVDEDQANGGVRREPELPIHVEIAPQPSPQANEFDFGGDSDNDEDAARSERLRARMVANSRQAALDPGDGIEL